jgi:hypothetical protein
MLRYQVSTMWRCKSHSPPHTRGGAEARFEGGRGPLREGGGDQNKVTSSTWAATCSLPTHIIKSKVPNSFSFFLNFVTLLAKAGFNFSGLRCSLIERHFKKYIAIIGNTFVNIVYILTRLSLYELPTFPVSRSNFGETFKCFAKQILKNDKVYKERWKRASLFV